MHKVLQGTQELSSWRWEEDVPGKANVCTVPQTLSRAQTVPVGESRSLSEKKKKDEEKGWTRPFRSQEKASELRQRNRQFCLGDLVDELP